MRLYRFTMTARKFTFEKVHVMVGWVYHCKVSSFRHPNKSLRPLPSACMTWSGVIPAASINALLMSSVSCRSCIPFRYFPCRSSRNILDISCLEPMSSVCQAIAVCTRQTAWTTNTCGLIVRSSDIVCSDCLWLAARIHWLLQELNPAT